MQNVKLFAAYADASREIRGCSESNDHRERQAKVTEQLGTGLPILVAEAVRDLTWRRELQHLTPKDTALLNCGRELLAHEMAWATDADVLEALEMIDGTLRTALAHGFDEPGPA